MKRMIILIIILLLITIPNINAIGKVYSIEFKEVNQQILTIGLKDRADFNLVGGSHTIIVSEIIPKKQIQFDVYRYINLDINERVKNYPVGYITLHPGEQVKLDLNKDKYNDLNIRIINIDKNETTLLLTALHECIFSDPKLCEKEDINEKPLSKIEKIKDYLNKNKTGFIITLSIIIVGLLIFFIFRKKSKS